MFFNRVTKVGSQKLVRLLRNLARKNKFVIGTNVEIAKRPLFYSKADQHKLVLNLTSINEPIAYFEHINYINFTTFDLPRPIYINMVRDPIERTISWYYYIRTPTYDANRRQKFPNITFLSPEILNTTFESCVEQKQEYCNFEQDNRMDSRTGCRQAIFFCGQSTEDCIGFNSARTLQIAKRNVEAEYAVVGSWEDTHITLAVLEAYIPRYFKGATKTYNEIKNRIENYNRNKLKPVVIKKTKELLRQNFTNEIEFYKFCKQRLYRQYFALKFGSKLEKNITIN